MRRVEDIFDCEKYHYLRETNGYEKSKNKDAIADELKESDHDFHSAQRDMDHMDHKWASIKAYYSMYHTAKAFLRAINTMGKGHECIYIKLDSLTRKSKDNPDHVDPRYVELFRITLDYRIEADYEHTYDEKAATNALNISNDFNGYMKSLINNAGY